MKSFRLTALSLLVGMGVASFTGAAHADDLRLIGSGASFPFPIYAAWLKDFSKKIQGATVDYQAKGSGAGIQDFINHTVDFAGSDVAMKDADIAKVEAGVVLLPMTAGEIVLAYNLPGVKELKLSRAAYVGIFRGQVLSWNDAAIKAANPGVALPDLPITVVTRSDSSGTTGVFTQHLSAVSAEFKSEIGTGTTVPWPKTAKFVAAPKNDGVTATVKQTPGAVGYIEYGYAKLTKADTALLENKAGKYMAPTPESGAAALASAKFNGDDLRVWVDDPDAAEAYPIATFTWMLFYKKQDPKKAEVLRQLVEYGITEGQKVADSLGYIPLPESVVAKVRAVSAQIQ